MNNSDAAMERLTDLLAAEAVGGLEPQESAELEELMSAGTGLERDELMTVASLMQVGFLRQDAKNQERMPDELRAKLAQQAKDFFDKGPAQTDPTPVSNIETARRVRDEKAAGKSRWLSTDRAGWYLAAALALAFVIVRGGPDTASTPEQTPDRAALLAAAGVVVAPWAASAAAEGYENVTGDVVWSTETQSGYMRLSGLVANNPESAQYQLWIVDPNRDEKPVDGGVFDVPAGQGEVVIPIDPKLRIESPAAFAITLEKPGGVVVSGGPLLVVAPVAS
jgi:anti-sigma-K factor RskA